MLCRCTSEPVFQYSARRECAIFKASVLNHFSIQASISRMGDFFKEYTV